MEIESFQLWFPQGICPVVVLFLVFKGILILFTIAAVSICIPTTVQDGSLFSKPSLVFTACGLFDDGHSDRCEVIPHCSSDLHLSNNKPCSACFHVLISHLYVFFGEMSV